MIVDSVFLTGLATVVGGLITFSLGHLSGRRKNAAEIGSLQAATRKTDEEADRLRIVNLKNTISIYEQVHNELSKRLEDVSHQCAGLRIEIVELRKENQALKKELHKLTTELQNGQQ